MARRSYALVSVLLMCSLAPVDALAQPVAAAAGSVCERIPGGPPEEALLESGDLLWPKHPNALIPYNSRVGEASEEDRMQWLDARDRYLELIRESGAPNALERERFRLLQGMSYEEFLTIYVDDDPATGVTPRSGSLGTGHVAVVRVRPSGTTVVEAMLVPGVREISYSAWCAERRGEKVWHGRLRDAMAENRAAIAESAAAYLGRPYRFFNFDLADDSGFYCSKLAWLAILKATGVAVDDNPEPKRLLWFSPKQLLKSPRLQILQNPGNYGG